MLKAQAMVLAAGLGTRLWPLTADRAKPAVPFLGRPLVMWVVELVRRHGISHIVVNTHHQAESVRAALVDFHAESPVIFSHETEILGTAGCLSEALARGLLKPDTPTLVINAKLFTDIDLAAAYQTHTRSGAAVTMVLRPNTAREAFREVLVRGGRVVGFGAGRVPTAVKPLLFTGIHWISPEVLLSIPRGLSDTVTDVYPPLIETRRVAAHIEASGRWWEFSTLERYVDLHIRAAAEGLGPDVVVGAGATVAAGARVTRSVLWDDACVPADAELDRVVLGTGVCLAAGSRLKNTVVVQRRHAGAVERGETRGENVFVPLA